MTIDLLDHIAAICTTVSFLPQAIKTIKSGDTRSLSLTMYSSFTIGVFFWLFYGIAIGDKALIAANIVTGVLAKRNSFL